ncbi:hypothetical protein DY000_02009561 [Brassica cretica]|uniref:SBP-type domain-containing protein n=1 Tax=Brassica cretica TaxID=69181 RepID=A0ABQ7BZ23_BRACR|nr:hypothetical protein DY000_02009561 [Brassica cretica]
MLCQKRVRQQLHECRNKRRLHRPGRDGHTAATQTDWIEESESRRRRVMKARVCRRPYAHRFSLCFWPPKFPA